MLVFQRATSVVHDFVYSVRNCTQAGRLNLYTIVTVFRRIIPELVTLPTCTGVTIEFFGAWNVYELLPM